MHLPAWFCLFWSYAWVGDDREGSFPLDFPPWDSRCSLWLILASGPFRSRTTRESIPLGSTWNAEMRHVSCIGDGGVYLTYRHGTGEYSAGKCMILLLLVIYKVIDGYADVYESEFPAPGQSVPDREIQLFRTILPCPPS